MIPKGQKRKLPAEDEGVSDRNSPGWESQRQFVFSVSLIKYQHSQELVEPSLRRFVLIANTLRQFDLQGSGDSSTSPQGSSPPPASATTLQVKEKEITELKQTVNVSFNSPDRGPKRNMTSGHSADPGVPAAVQEEDWGSMSTEPDFEVETAIASILSALDSTIDGSPQAAQRPPLRSLENLSEGGASWEKQDSQACFEAWGQQPETCRAPESGVPSGYLSEVTVEDLFQDIDTSLLETDMEALGVRGGYPAADDLLRYLPPFIPSPDSFTVTLNQNLKGLPAFSSFIPASSASSPALFPAPHHLREGFELEHLVEVLVES